MFQQNSSNYKKLQEQEKIPSEKSITNSTGFHLQNKSLGAEPENEVCLIKREYKQRIDSMFDETRSNLTESGIENTTGPLSSSETSKTNSNILEQFTSQPDRTKIKNIVQARIERMFTDVSSSEFEEDMGRGSRNILRYQVDYIGSSPLNNKVTSLEGLQEPLKNLYFTYRKNKYPGSNFKSVLEISDHGLKVHNFDEKHGHVIEELNPFPKIAVWASMKFVYRPSRDGKMGYEYAFLPIVIDPTNTERSNLFRELNHEDFPYAIERTYDDHSPLFVVIMKKSDYYTSNGLQCHGFVCATSEDAIVLAANLYKALVAAMNYNQLNAAKKKKKIKCRYGLGVVRSVGGSSVGDEQEFLFSKEQKPLRENFRSRISSKELRNSNRPGKSLLEGETQQLEVEISTNTNNNGEDGDHDRGENVSELISKNGALKSDAMENVDYIKTIETTYCDNNSSNSHNRPLTNESFDSGDVFTRVVIPRSGSFLNVSVPVSSRYNRPTKSYVKGSQLQPRKNSIHSPLGFKELFNEFHIQEGLNNIDEILSTIINVNGMSFNSLKPIYKEFIFKFAVTLTKDELYQRSKSIMQKQKRKKQKLMQRTYKTSRKLKRFFRSSWSKLSPKKYRNRKPFLTTVSSFFERFKPRPRAFKPKNKLKRHNFSMTSASDSFLGLNQMRKTNLTHNSNDTTYSRRPFYLWNDIQDSQFKPQDAGQYIHDPILSFNSLSLASRSDHIHINKHQPNSLGYFSCSDNSESCAYNTSQRCYCSMKPHFQSEITDCNKVTPVSSCSCDTDSCLESEKCYCNQSKKPSMIEQLKQQGFAASESSLSRPGSPVLGQSRKGDNTENNHIKSCVKPSKSLEFFQVEQDRLKDFTHMRSSEGYNKFLKLSCSNDLRKSHKQLKKLQKQQGNRKFIRNNISTSSFQNVLLRSVPFHKYNDNLDVHIMAEDFRSGNSVGRDSFADDSDFVDEDDDDYDDNDGVDGCRDVRVSRNGFFPPENRSQNKILVVSARDQKGQVKQVFTPMGYGKSLNIGRNEQDSDAMSVKKSAEIAALFSGVKIDKRHFNLSTSENKLSSSFNSTESVLWRGGRSLCIKNSNLENSLGYFP